MIYFLEKSILDCNVLMYAFIAVTPSIFEGVILNLSYIVLYIEKDVILKLILVDHTNGWKKDIPRHS